MITLLIVAIVWFALNVALVVWVGLAELARHLDEEPGS